jgi:hypothetical protein
MNDMDTRRRGRRSAVQAAHSLIEAKGFGPSRIEPTWFSRHGHPTTLRAHAGASWVRVCDRFNSFNGARKLPTFLVVVKFNHYNFLHLSLRPQNVSLSKLI